MYKYKRQIDSIENISKSKFILSDKVNTVVSLNSDFSIDKPFNGLYIKDGKVIISNLSEEIITKDNKYRISNISSNAGLNNEYILNVDLESHLVEYKLEEVDFSKQIYLEEKTGILVVKYNINNKGKYDINFKVIPVLTYRELYSMKNFSMLKFNQRNENQGVVLNLSILNNEDVILKSDKFEWNKDVEILNNKKYGVRVNNNDIENYEEDLMVPGYFDLQVKAGRISEAAIYITQKDINLSKISIEEISKKEFFLKENINNSIEHEYIELKELSYGINKLNFDNILVNTLPYDKNVALSTENISIQNNKINEVLELLIDITKAIEGQYLSFGNIKEATRKIVNVQKYINYIDKVPLSSYDLKYKFVLLKLWCVESINRIVQKQDLFEIFFNLTNNIIFSILNDNLNDKYFKNIEAAALMYNALKIYEDMLYKKGKVDRIVFEKLDYLKQKIEKDFWDEEKRVMKKNLDEEEVYANVEMLYTISLSYPCIMDSVQFKLLDTVFKELYTPYGLREYSKFTNKNTGLIYPKYMAHFVKANLRQNGVTRASRKIAFNLVKELLLDINKYVNCGVKKIYSEKGYSIDTLPYDLLTNAEVIRLYDMLI